MREKGYDRDWQQCRTKIKNLKKEYRQTKDHNGQTGRGRKVCKFYRELDSILGHQPASVPAVLLDTGTTSNSSSATENHQGPSSSAEGREEIETNGNNILYINLTRLCRTYILLSCQQMEMMFKQIHPWTVHLFLVPRRAAQMSQNLGMKRVCICQACSICVLT